ncbi:MAG: flagellar hook capping FlgD N-terminal domain-containing protein [Gemmatimonadaceae bacterium]
MSTSITPTTPSATSATTPQRDGSAVGAGGKLGKNEFLQLLTTQMRYQDPMNPMDGSKMAADLAQFSGLEQLVNINDALTSQQSQFNTMLLAINNSVALSTIGKTVMAEGNQVMIAKDATGAKQGKVVADIATEGDATLTILNAAGKEIASRPLGHLAAGDKMEFDVGSATQKLSEGMYTYRIDVKDAKGVTTTQKSYSVGKVDGISYNATGAVLTAGPMTFNIGSVVKIFS